MKNPEYIPHKIYDVPSLLKQVAIWKFLGKKVAFTNGCFDLLHQGHIAALSAAANEGDVLIVALNADISIKKLKGEDRPVNNQHSRSLIMASLVMVDAVVVFEEETPLELIKIIMPDVLVKGGDYPIEEIVGAKEVIANGGRVTINPILEGFSTSGMIDKINNC
ncbi:MAG: D-glycero-beta-D-manno-heptose 1-phosphate adenylyltransferase [Chitinophagaceae bacterium]